MVVNIKQLRKAHYESAEILIDRIERREIAFARDGGSLSDRANSFATVEELSKYLQSALSVNSVYSSIAYFEDPNVYAINKRGTMGADLAFDVDMEPTGSRLDWMFDVCAITSEVVTRLSDDLGFKREEMTLDFSGGKGFHITINNPSYRDLSKKDRKQLLDYIRGESLKASYLDANIKGGWHGQYRHFISSLAPLMTDDAKQNAERLIARGFAKVHAKKLGDLATMPGYRQDLATGRLIGVSDKAVASSRGAFKARVKRVFSTVDRTVTADINRVLRVPGTIHNKTGLVSVRIPLEALDDPDVIFQAVKQAGGLDPVEITLDEPKVEDFDRVHEWPAGTHTVPRWLALHLLH